MKSRLFKERKHEDDHTIALKKALNTTMKTCIASTSALVDSALSRKITQARMAQYSDNSLRSLAGIGEIRHYLQRISKHMENKKIKWLDARAAVINILEKNKTGNCEHQSFYLAAELKKQNIPALIYNIKDIEHTIVLTTHYLLDPWIGCLFPISTTNLLDFYDSALDMEASWLNQLLSTRKIDYPKSLDAASLMSLFEIENDHKEKKCMLSSLK